MKRTKVAELSSEAHSQTLLRNLPGLYLHDGVRVTYVAIDGRLNWANCAAVAIRRLLDLILNPGPKTSLPRC